MSWRPDPEIDDLFPDPGDRRLAQSLRSVHAPEVSADPAFRSQLRRHLMQEAWESAEPRMGWWRRLWAPQRVAWAMAAAGAVLIAVVVYTTSGGGGDRTVLIRANVDPTTPVAAVQPVVLTFSQPMNRQSVESSLQVQPATAVSYEWSSDTQVKIVPVASFAPNTQYTVVLSKPAETQQGRSVPAAPAAVFTVKPAPTPAPTATATPPPAPALDITVLAPAADAKPQWTYQGKIASLSPSGALQLVPADGGSPEVLAESGVTAFALSSDQGQGGIAFVQAGQLKAWTNGSVQAAPAPGVTAIAAGFSGRAQYASATQATDPQGHEVKLQAAATSAWFAPDGTRLLYAAGDRSLHELDFGSGKETAWPAGAATFLAWAPDGSKVLYATADGIFTADPTGQSPTRLAALSGVTAADWPAAGRVVAEAGGKIHDVGADGSDRVLGSASAAGLAVSPGGSIAMTGGGKLAVGQPAGGSGLSVDAASPVVGAFENARQAGNPAAAAAVTASSARLAAPAAGIQRWFTIAAFRGQDGVHETVRVVLADKSGKDTSQLDETLLVVSGPNGKAVVASASDSAPRPYGQGPEVLGVSLTGGKVVVEMDSYLAPAAPAGTVRLTDAAGKPVPATVVASGRIVTLTPAAPLASGNYRLSVGTALLDTNGRPAATEFDLDVPVIR